MEKNDGYWLDCDFVSGACYSYDNGVQHIAASQVLANGRNYGFAVSHLILGAEELIKALILVFLNTDSHFIDNKRKEKLFSNHSFKHLNIKNFLLALSNDNLEEYDYNFFDYLFEKQPENDYQRKAHYLSKVLNLGAIDESELNDITELIKDANGLKNRGFYVDYDGDWKIPLDVDQTVYEKYLGLINKLMQFAQPVFTTPLDNDALISFIYGD